MGTGPASSPRQGVAADGFDSVLARFRQGPERRLLVVVASLEGVIAIGGDVHQYLAELAQVQAGPVVFLQIAQANKTVIGMDIGVEYGRLPPGAGRGDGVIGGEFEQDFMRLDGFGRILGLVRRGETRGLESEQVFGGRGQGIGPDFETGIGGGVVQDLHPRPGQGFLAHQRVHGSGGAFRGYP